MKKDCTVLVGSCDAYVDIWDPFFTLLRRFWPDNPYDVVLSTETLKYPDGKIRTINPDVPDVSWTERMIDALSKIDSKYIILILDDFFLYDRVQTKKVEQCLRWMRENPDIATFTFWPACNDTEECDYPGFGKRPARSLRKVAGVLGIWNKKKMTNYLNGINGSAWEWEAGNKLANIAFLDDEFYRMTNDDYIFPYDFTKYGLCNGKWFKETKVMFAKLKINFDFSKRGYYDEAASGLSRSIISAFEMDSAIVPFYALKHRRGEIPYFATKNISKTGGLFQRYEIKGAHSIIRWELATHWGFAIKDLKIRIIYMDRCEEEVDNKILFGNFLVLNKRFIFNTQAPHMYIPTIKGKKIRRVQITANTTMPISKKDLEKTFKKITKPRRAEYESLCGQLWWEYMLIPEKVQAPLSSQILFKQNGKNDERNKTKGKEVIRQGSFSERYEIPGGVDEVVWTLREYGGFLVKDLKVVFHYINGNSKTVQQAEGGHFKIRNNYVFVDKPVIKVPIPEDEPIAFTISGEFVCPIPNKILKQLFDKTHKTPFGAKASVAKIAKKVRGR